MRLRFPIVVRRVRGASMAPTLADGDFVVALRHGPLLRRLKPPSAGDVVVLEPNDDATKRSKMWLTLQSYSLVKRIDRLVEGSGLSAKAFRIRGDNPLSMAPEHFGAVTIHDIYARAVLRIPKAGRVRLLRRRSPMPSSHLENCNR